MLSLNTVSTATNEIISCNTVEKVQMMLLLGCYDLFVYI